MYPAPATSNFANPSGSGISATISSAILRGAFRKLLGEFKRKRHGELAHLDLGRLVDGDVRQVDLVLLAEEFSDVGGQLFLSL